MTTVTIIEKGPILVKVTKDDTILTKYQGTEITTVDTVAICTCDKSDNMPFCSGAHKKKVDESSEV